MRGLNHPMPHKPIICPGLIIRYDEHDIGLVRGMRGNAGEQQSAQGHQRDQRPVHGVEVWDLHVEILTNPLRNANGLIHLLFDLENLQ